MAKKASRQALAQARALIQHHNFLSSVRGDSSRDAVIREDADETNMLALQLEQLRTRVYEDVHTPLKARQFLPVSSEIDTGAETFSYEETDYYGEAKLITNYADDPPMVETDGQKITHKINPYGNGYHYSIQDIRAAAFAGKPLPARKAIAARRLWERKLDDVAALGDPNAGIPSGALNNSSVGIEALAAAGAWSTKTAQQILDDMNALVDGFVTTSAENFMPDTMLLPLAQYLLVSKTRFSVDNPETVLEAFLRANPMIQMVEPWDKLAGAGAASTDRAMVYMRDPMVLELVVPQEFEVLPPQPANYGFKVLCHGRTGGCPVYMPLGVRYQDGI